MNKFTLGCILWSNDPVNKNQEEKYKTIKKLSFFRIGPPSKKI